MARGLQGALGSELVLGPGALCALAIGGVSLGEPLSRSRACEAADAAAWKALPMSDGSGRCSMAASSVMRPTLVGRLGPLAVVMAGLAADVVPARSVGDWSGLLWVVGGT